MSFLFESPRKIIKIGERVLKRDPNLKRLEEAVQKLDKVSADVTTFLHLLDSAKQEQKEQEVDFYKTRETGSLPTTNNLIGRGMDKELVMEWLRKPSNNSRTSRYGNISFLSIVGHGGMGKTTLLQHVYEDDEITKEFDLKMWVCVSNNFDVKKVITDMLESLEKERPRLETLKALHDSLEEVVNSKRFLLVLDDVWEEKEERDKSKWGNVLAPLACGGFGSKILVTTRTDSVALMFEKVILEKTEPLRLEGLEKEECLELLNTHAFAVDNLDDQRKLKLKLITAEIVKKLSGSPLAAKVIGGILNSNLDEGHWSRVLDSDLEIIKLGQNDIMPILRLSYVHLPQHLKSCFTFCSIFLPDYQFDKDDLVRMWISLGFIQQPHDQEWTMEDIGRRYFHDLVKKSFFDKFQDGSYYKMHDLIHELAQSISIHECLRVEDDTKLPSIIPKTLRHLSVQTTNLDFIKKIGQFKYLHSLFLFYKASNQDFYNALIEIFKASRSLRLLFISPSKDLEIPGEIENLIHLRFLKIYNLIMLPRSLRNLHHLQYIICIPPRSSIQTGVVDFLPSDINNLSNLRYMKFPWNIVPSICGIGKLKSLQEVNMFGLRDASGYRIGELENMNDLCKLGINCLENVKDAEEACSANLCAKRRLTDLSLCWSNTDLRNINLDETVLDNLQPPKCLRNLRIESYMGARSATWMNNFNLISNLEKIELSLCTEWETLPPFGQLPLLKSLKLSNMPKVKWLESKINGNDKYHPFPLLEELHIWGLEELEDWFEAGVAAEDGCLFPRLIELDLFDCPKLDENVLNKLQPPKCLRNLRIESYMGARSATWMNNFNLISNLEKIDLSLCKEWETLPPFGQLPFLKSLKLSNMPKIKWLESKINGNDKYHAFPLLEELHIYRLEALEDWFEAGVAAEDGCLFPRLIELDLSYCPKLKELPSLPSKLERLEIRKSGWKSLKFCSNSNPIALKSLCVFDCPNITSLPLADEIARLAALRKLTITKCPNLISLGEMQTTNNCHLMLSDLIISDPSVLLMEPLRSIASLKELTISGNDELVSFPNEAEQWFRNVSSSLCELQFVRLKSLESLPSYLESLSSLQKLCIYDVPMLRELPNLPPSLESLTMLGRYHPELKERYRKHGGSDRHKIAHIPIIHICE